MPQGALVSLQMSAGLTEYGTRTNGELWKLVGIVSPQPVVMSVCGGAVSLLGTRSLRKCRILLDQSRSESHSLTPITRTRDLPGKLCGPSGWTTWLG